MLGQLTNTARDGNDVATFPDFDEIGHRVEHALGYPDFRSICQRKSSPVTLDALVVMNPAAMVTNLDDLRHGGILIANEDGFNEKEFKLAKVDSNPLDANVLEETYRIIKVPMTKLTREAVSEFGLSTKVADRCKNFFAMGLVYWLFGRSLDPTLRFIQAKFSKKPEIASANEAALRAGWRSVKRKPLERAIR